MAHRDGGDVVATHYCAQGNQPRLRAAIVGADSLTLRFADATDVDADEAVLVELSFAFAEDHFERVETYRTPDRQLDVTRWRFARTAP